MNQLVRIEFDGGSRGNPGPAAGAAIILLPGAEKVETTRFLAKATNNQAEYTGALLGLRKAIELGLQNIELAGDSQLVLLQLAGDWEVKTPHLHPLWQEAQALLKKLDNHKLSWIPRAENKLADAAVNRCIDTGLGINRSALAGLRTPAAAPRLASVIEELVRKQDQDQVKFKDLMALKVGGTDEFSQLGLAELRDRVPAEVQAAIQAGLGNQCTEESIAKALRWYLRGLTPTLAVRKVATDLEISGIRSQRTK